MITSELLKIPQTEFLKTFEIAIQLGAILSVVVLYYKVLLGNRENFLKVCVAFLPTAIIGFALYPLIKRVFLSNTTIVLWSLFLGGIFLVIFELVYREKKTALTDITQISYPQAIFIGVFQSFAMVPGVSRAAATIVGGMLLGLKRKTIVEFSFLLAVPTMAAAVALDLLKNMRFFSLTQVNLLAIGFVMSFIVALLAIKLFLSFIQKNSFMAFGIYRIIAAILFSFLLSK